MVTKWFTSFLCGVALVGVTLGSALPASAEQAPDKNGPGVARVSILDGSAVVQRGDSNSQVAAVVNAPLLPGDYVSTGGTSRAELQFDGYTAVRLGHSVQTRITSNDPSNRGLQLADGTVEVGLVHAARAFTVDTPSVSVRAQEAGDYRVSVSQDGSTWVSVRRGKADVITPGHNYTLETGRTLVARGSASDPSITYTSQIGYDTFDDFNAKRDQTMLAAVSASPNVSPDIAGYDNLDNYGQWQDVAGYGQAWVPNQSSDWAPYQNGNWTWEDGYGWTWVAAEPWGWAPYHYGRWTYANGYGWAWVPPAYVGYYDTQPAWSPALVGFFGFGLSVGGAGWGVNVGYGDYGGYGGFGYPYIGWYPLAPYAAYYPWYPGWAWSGWGWGWPGYVGWGGCCYGGGWGTRVVNVTNIRNYYGSWGHHAVTGTLRGNFEKGNFSHNLSVDPRNISHAGTIRGAVPVSPTRSNLSFASGDRGTVRAPITLSKAFNSPRFASNRALAARPSFAQQQRAVSQAIHGGNGRETAPVTSHENAARDNGAARDNTLHESAGRQGAPTSSWQRFNQARGNEERAGLLSGQSGRVESGRTESVPRTESAPRSESGRVESESARNSGSLEGSRGTPDSWNRFSQSRGNVSAGYSRSESSRGESYGGASSRDGYGRSDYSRGTSYGSSYSHGNPYASESRSSYPSYSRGSGSSYSSYSRGNSYPSYSRGSGSSYGSYSRSNSYPSYSRGSGSSYGSYSRGASYPSYSRGSGGSYGSYSHGPSGGGQAPRPSGGGQAPHPSGGGEPGGGGGGRPPQQ